jgi:hypothetical protein
MQVIAEKPPGFSPVWSKNSAGGGVAGTRAEQRAVWSRSSSLTVNSRFAPRRARVGQGDLQRLLHETEDVGGEVTNTYAAGTQNEFGDLIGEGDGQSHTYEARANTDALLDSGGAVEARYKYTAFGEVDAVSLEGWAWSRGLEISSAGVEHEHAGDRHAKQGRVGEGNRRGKQVHPLALDWMPMRIGPIRRNATRGPIPADPPAPSRRAKHSSARQAAPRRR